MSLRPLAPLATIALLWGFANAQDVAPLVREEPEIKVRVEPRTTPSPTPEAGRRPVAATPTPDPALVLVAIVNGHSLTRAELDQRMTARTGNAKELLKKSPGGEQILGKNGPVNEAAVLDSIIVAEEQQSQVREAIRKEEGEVVQGWVEQTLLSDEARRQGFVISEDELKGRMAQIEREHDLADERVKRLLDVAGMTRADLEASIHDALLIEKLLDRFVQLNFPEDSFRKAFDQAPALYRRPASYRAANFAISLLGTEDKAALRNLKELAEKARKRLNSGENPAKVFQDLNDLEFGIYGADLGWFSIEQEGLPPAVRAEIAKMKPGDTSDVLTAYVKRDGKVVPESFHVVKLLDYNEPTGLTYETALPELRRSARELARGELLALLQSSGTHRVIVNLGGIPARKVPELEERLRAQPAIPLKLPPKEGA